MNNSEIQLYGLIEALNDKPIAFNKHYVRIGCGINGALMLSQLVYWSKRSSNNGFIYKTQDEWEDETGLTRREQETARKRLKELGFLIEVKRGVPCKVHYKVEFSVLYNTLISYAQKRQTSMAESAKLVGTNAPYSDGGKRQSITENTQENTSEIKKINKKNPDGAQQKKPESKNSFDAKSVELPENVNRDLWNQFVEMRNSLKKPLTENAVKLVLKKLTEFGQLANQAIETSIIGNYTGIYPPKAQSQHPITNQQNSNQAPQEPGYFMQLFADQQGSNVIDVTPDSQAIGGYAHE